ncbi:MAG TPA: ATP-binding protein [Lacunisphaera sp.]|nr:ATP-binding protein [Lacunisphaera sp.]
MSADIRAHRFFSHFPAAQGAKLAALVRLVRFSHKEVIFEEGSEPDCIYLVFTGRVALAKKSPGGGSQIIAHKGPDDYFGELGVMDGSVRSTAAIADGPLQLGRLGAKPFIQALSESSWHTVLRLFSQVSENLRATNDRYVNDVMRKEKITLVGEMANSMIHDFRGPFSTIKLATELIAKHNNTPQNQELCTMILRQVERLGGMVEEVLDFARGETRLKIKVTPLQDSLDLLQENNLEVLARAGISLRVRPVRIVLPLDADRFQRVLQNLVTNAREALVRSKGGRITVAARRVGRQCIITVADNGPGIPKDIRGTLFEPFVSQGKTGGTGLGLSIARAVVEAHRGAIDFATSRRGTTFTITLPLE